jgi:ribosome maturation factor RimP
LPHFPTGRGPEKSPFLLYCIRNMGTLTAIIREIAEAATEGTDVFIISVTANRNETMINIAIDADTQLSMEKITLFSRAVSKAVDERDPGDHKFTLEIGSPGADQPLQNQRQLPKHIGRNVHVLMRDGSEWKGKLTQAEGGLLQLEIPGLKKKDPATTVQLQWEELAKITIDLKY